MQWSSYGCLADPYFRGCCVTQGRFVAAPSCGSVHCVDQLDFIDVPGTDKTKAFSNQSDERTGIGMMRRFRRRFACRLHPSHPKPCSKCCFGVSLGKVSATIGGVELPPRTAGTLARGSPSSLYDAPTDFRKHQNSLDRVVSLSLVLHASGQRKTELEVGSRSAILQQILFRSTPPHGGRL